jgi:peptidyl-prolyl isomerase H (cyclophilin H)
MEPNTELDSALASGNRVVFMDLSIGGVNVGRLKIELFSSSCPKTAENFRQLCTGETKYQNLPVGYKGVSFHRSIPGFMVQGGDCTGYGSSFPDENFKHDHSEAGLLSMANSGPNSNGCQFFITFGVAKSLNNKHCVFGKLLGQNSMLVLRKLEAVPVKQDKPQLPIIVTECGEL